MRKEEVAAVVIDEVTDIIYIADIETYQLQYLNRANLEVLGNISEEEWRDKPCYKILQGNDEPCPFCTNHLIKENEFYQWEHYNETLGRYFSLKDKLIVIDGRLCRLEVATDITEARLAAEELKERLFMEETLVKCVQTLYENTDNEKAVNKLLSIVADYYQADCSYIFEIDYKRNILNNTYEWCKKGIAPQIRNLQQVPAEVIERWHVPFKEREEFYISSIHENLDKNSAEYKILKAQGIDSLMASPLKLGDKMVGFLGVDNPRARTDNMLLIRSVAAFVINDIEKRKNDEMLYELSYADNLTGLGNRHGYVEYLKQLEKEPSVSLGILFADINGLKIANDTYGHEYGDRLIQEVAESLKCNFKENIYRIGGDEFVVFCVGIGKEEFERKVEALRKCGKCQENKNISIGASWHAVSIDIEAQVAEADELMYIDKQEYYKRSLEEKERYKEQRNHKLLLRTDNKA